MNLWPMLLAAGVSGALGGLVGYVAGVLDEQRHAEGKAREKAKRRHPTRRLRAMPLTDEP